MFLIYLNKFETAKGLMLAMCDEELMGKVLKEGKTEIDLERYGAFYRGKLVSEEEAKKELAGKVYSANVVGDRSVGLLIEKGIVKKEEVRRVQNVAFVHLFRML